MQNPKLHSLYIEAEKFFLYKKGNADNLKQMLKVLNAEDFQLTNIMQVIHNYSDYTAKDIFTGDNFHMSLFVVPQGCELALHDHPGMSVLMRVVWGEMYIKSYDWVKEYPWSGLARVTLEKTMNTLSNIAILHPEYANIHYIKALTDCAFIDLFSPHYSEEEGRNCTYYREIEDIISATGEKLTRLEKI